MKRRESRNKTEPKNRIEQSRREGNKTVNKMLVDHKTEIAEKTKENRAIKREGNGVTKNRAQ